MDGSPNSKKVNWKGTDYSETYYAVISWLERELPNITGDVLHISNCNLGVPGLLTNKNIGKYVTFGKRMYGAQRNKIDIVGDIHSLPDKWKDTWDCIICNQIIASSEDPFAIMEEFYRTLKLGGVLLIDAPFNYRFSGPGSWYNDRQNKQAQMDYWRITHNGWEMLTKKFNNVKIERSGPDKHDPYVYMIKAHK